MIFVIDAGEMDYDSECESMAAEGLKDEREDDEE